MVAKRSIPLDAEQIGAIWIHETKDKKTALTIHIDGEKYIGLQPNKPTVDTADTNIPDYYVLRFMGKNDISKAEIVGSIWQLAAVDGREVLSIEIGKERNDPLIAVMLNNSENETAQGPDMVIFRKR